MAPLPANNTPRYRVFYTNASQQHTLNLRSSDSPAAFGSDVNDLFALLTNHIFPTTIDEVQWAPTGSNIFNVVVTGIEGNTYGNGTPSVSSPAVYIDFVGRSSGGRRVRAAIFGFTSVGGDFRIQPGELPQVDAAIALLNLASNGFLAIDGLKPVWKSYANAGFNAYWQRAIRP